MPAPISHIFLALHVLVGSLQNVDRHSFILGTSFPDIRYLGVIDRRKTHLSPVSFDLIKQEKDSFRAGMMFHALVDQVHEQYMQKHDVYDQIHSCLSHFKGQLLKLAADRIIHQHFQMTPYLTCFDMVTEEEKVFGIQENNIHLWHDILQFYCADGPCLKTYKKLSDLVCSQPTIKVNKMVKRRLLSFLGLLLIDREVKYLCNNEYVKKHVLYFYTHFDDFV